MEEGAAPGGRRAGGRAAPARAGRRETARSRPPPLPPPDPGSRAACFARLIRPKTREIGTTKFANIKDTLKSGRINVGTCSGAAASSTEVRPEDDATSDATSGSVCAAQSANVASSSTHTSADICTPDSRCQSILL